MQFDAEPDLSFDAYLCMNGRRGPLCDVQVWLPKQASDDGVMKVTAFDFVLDELRHVVNLSLLQVGDPPQIELRDIFIRSASMQLGRKTSAVELKIEHVGMLVERSIGCSKDVAKTQPDNAVFLLSDMRYALPDIAPEMNYFGNIDIRKLEPTLNLLIKHRSGVDCTFTLERHWNFAFDREDVSVLGRSNAVLVFAAQTGKSTVALSVLQKCADDAALLLSLASRRRVTVYGFSAMAQHEQYKQWDYLLHRARAQGVEETEGYLVKRSELESFMQVASERLAAFDTKERDAVHLAIFALNPVLKATQEATFLNCFTALEGLARIFGAPFSKAGMHSIIKALVSTYPPQIAGLWPILGDQGLAGLKDLRNELAHGQNFSRQVPGALGLANDHLQLWIEYFLMAIFHANSNIDPHNWLRRNAAKQSAETLAIRQALRVAGVVSK